MIHTLHSWGVSFTHFERGLSIWFMLIAVAILLVLFGLISLARDAEYRRIDREYQEYFKRLDELEKRDR